VAEATAPPHRRRTAPADRPDVPVPAADRELPGL